MSARAKFVEDRYLELMALSTEQPLGKTRERMMDVAEQLRQLHVALLKEETEPSLGTKEEKHLDVQTKEDATRPPNSLSGITGWVVLASPKRALGDFISWGPLHPTRDNALKAAHEFESLMRDDAFFVARVGGIESHALRSVNSDEVERLIHDEEGANYSGRRACLRVAMNKFLARRRNEDIRS